MLQKLLYFLRIKKKHDCIIKKIKSNGIVIGFHYFILGKYSNSFVDNRKVKLKTIKDLY